ncbi:MAG: hypothetical protein D4R65_00965 [Verrucomicrobiaceae bacterium]|nr:MAG: hypothetical protein D4R65_00965 [Verrucomicrobiaceae bacterium]
MAGPFRELLESDPDLHWKITASGSYDRPEAIELELDGKRLPYVPVYDLKPSFSWLESLSARNGSPLLLVTPTLSSRVLEFCKQRGIAATDLNGRIWLRAPGLLVDRRPLPGRDFRYELEPRNVFVGKSARIIRALLTDLDRTWNQSELVKRTEASSGLVSRIIQYLISQGFAEKTSPREFRLRDGLELLHAWRESDRFAKRTITHAYAGYLGSPADLAKLLQEWARQESVSIAFTQWIAAWVRRPYTEPPLASAYVSRLPDAATLASHGLRPVTEGGKLWLHLPDDPGLLTETQSRGELTLTTDAQIYLDLQSTGLRGPDAAGALLEWDGFCKP